MSTACRSRCRKEARASASFPPRIASGSPTKPGIACAGPVTVTPQSNRMGYRLEGPALAHVRGADILSEAMPIGVDPGAGIGPADPADGGTSDDGRLCDDRERDHRGSADCWTTASLATGSSSSPCAREDALAALRLRHAALTECAHVTDDRASAFAAPSGPIECPRDAPLAPFTTFKVGGPADWLVLAQRARRSGRRWPRRARREPPRHRPRRRIERADRGRGDPWRRDPSAWRRRRQRVGRARIRADGGLTINGLVRWTINRGVAGLEAWAGTPGTVGGAITATRISRGG